MKDLIKEFPKQLQSALKIAEEAKLRHVGKRPANVLITGLGGSGIGGSIVADLCAQTARIPIAVNKGYNVPHWVGADTLVIASSYSGNTEETLEASAQALEYGAMLAAVTSGGKLKELAKERGLNHILIPGGNPPRSMLAYSFVQLFRILSDYSVHTPDYQTEIAEAAAFLESEQENIIAEAKKYAQALENKVVATYAANGLGGVATRWRQQFNENAKMLGWDAVIPEMNHNELVGWAGGSDELAAIILRSEDEHERVGMRADLNAKLISEYTSTVLEIHAKGDSPIARVLYLIHLGDYISLHLSEMKGCDIMDIRVIEELKAKLEEAH